MEMQKIPSEAKETGEEEAAGGALLEVKTQEEAESAYDTLQSPSEDIYADPLISTSVKTKGQQAGGNERLYRCGCFVLTGLCLLLLMIVIFLSLKHGSQVCSVDECHQLSPFGPEGHGCKQCAEGWRRYGKACYFLSTVRLSWADSQKNCSSGGGSLVVINSRGIQHFLTETGNLGYWIGLRQNEAEWNWVNNTQLQTGYWSTSNKRGDCAILSSDDPEDKNWKTAPCQALTYFICQLQL